MKTAQGASKKRKLFGRKSQFIAFFTTQRLQRNRGFCAFFRICSFIELYFNPRSPHGERPSGSTQRTSEFSFQSTLPARGATTFRHKTPACLDISIHAPRTGSDQVRCCYSRQPPISIHAPRTGSDVTFCPVAIARSISIHAPRTGSDGITRHVLFVRKRFQSTLPARGATLRDGKRVGVRANFNPRSPHGERHAACAKNGITRTISIHAPRTGSDIHWQGMDYALAISIHAPRTGSDRVDRNASDAEIISIHAPRTGSDSTPAVAS